MGHLTLLLGLKSEINQFKHLLIQQSPNPRPLKISFCLFLLTGGDLYFPSSRAHVRGLPMRQVGR